MSDWNIGGIAVALVDDQRIVYAAGFGEAKRGFRVPGRQHLQAVQCHCRHAAS